MTIAASSPATSTRSSRDGESRADGARRAEAPAFHRERGGDHLDQQPHTHRAQLFSALGPEEVSRIAVHARSLRKARGEFIYMPGDRADSVYVLKQGRVKLSVLAVSGKEIAIDIIQPGEIFGEFALLDESPRSNMTQALDDVLLWVFGKRDFERLLSGQPKLAMSYIRLVGDRRRRMEKKLSDITSKDVAARVCELLHELAVDDCDFEAPALDYLVPLTHQDVASLIGASRQTTTSVLNDLERRGVIELGRGWMRVKSLKDLQTYGG
ncbi:MAG TPA: Crp/Fnr family transcriptional regulator [Pyrinomonadaceae bacterium]|nr:Crp/Fnr family transcriptional regulator [Pyrinomonadaceae bacterium]